VYRKDPTHYRAIGTEKSLAAMLDPDKHRIRRNALNPIFSKRTVASKQQLVLEKVFNAVAYINRRSKDNLPIDMDLLFRRITASLSHPLT
jgi:cytochrome P450